MDTGPFTDDDPGTRRLRYAAAASAAAGVVHVAAAVPHFTDDPLLGAGFVVIGWLQLLAATLLFRGGRSRGLLLSVLGLQVAAIGGWAVSRTVGLPVGHPGPEPVGLPDALTVVFEIAVVGLLAWRLRRPKAPRPARSVFVAGLVASWLVVISASALAVSDLALNGHGHAPEASGTSQAAHPHDPQASDGHHDEVTAEPVHQHPDGSVHLHAAADPHEHDDDTIHLHPVPASSHQMESSGGEADHTHAPGEEH